VPEVSGWPPNGGQPGLVIRFAATRPPLPASYLMRAAMSPTIAERV